VIKLARDFDVPKMKLTRTLENKDKIIYHFILSEYTQRHNTVCGNLNQRAL